MFFRREKGGNKATGTRSETHNSFENYVEQIVDLLAAASPSDISRNDWLTDQERRFFVATVICLNENITNPLSEKAVQIYKKYFTNSIDKKAINNYIRRIQKKGWIDYDKDGRYIKVPEIFYGIVKEKDFFEFKITVCYEANRQDSN